MNGRFLMIDGIAGSGKSTIIRSAKYLAETRGKKAFDLASWEGKEPPRFADVQDADVLFTFEPTRQWIGAAIRYELSRQDAPYDGTTLAHAFAADRFILYRRLILPALAAGKIVIQDRGVSSSIAYQPIMDGGPSLEELLALPGNAAALTRAPDVLLLTDVEPEVVAARIAAREDESKGVFADIAYLTRVRERFRAEWYAALFAERGTDVQTLNTRGEVADTLERVRPILENILDP